MIQWLTGNTGAGKTTLALKLKGPRSIILDGDAVREVNQDADLTDQGRWNNCLKIARLARMLEGQGFDVIVSVICPFEKLRQEVRQITGCTFIYLPYEGDDQIPESPYERPQDAEIVLPERVRDINQPKTRLELVNGLLYRKRPDRLLAVAKRPQGRAKQKRQDGL